MMDIAVLAKAVIGEIIVTKPACTTVPRQAVVDQTDNVVLAALDFGVYYVMKHVAMVV
jgi:hypothetical protein